MAATITLLTYFLSKKQIHEVSLHNFFRGNKERLARFGTSLALKSRQYRARRIAVNVKVNALTYLVELLGGMIIAALSFLKHAHILYTVGMIWYGNIIPLCYLINTADTKKLILEDGWTSALSKLCKKKEPKNAIETKSRMAMKNGERTRRNTGNDEPDTKGKGEEVAGEPNIEETHTETQTETITMSETSFIHEASTAGQKTKCGHKKCEKYAIKTKNKGEEVAGEPNTEETNTETETKTVAMSETSFIDEATTAGQKTKWGHKKCEKYAIKTTQAGLTDHDVTKISPMQQRNGVILYDLEDTNTSCAVRYFQSSPKNTRASSLPYGLPKISSAECSVYHISSNITKG